MGREAGNLHRAFLKAVGIQPGEFRKEFREG